MSEKKITRREGRDGDRAVQRERRGQKREGQGER
jgi:hypothetical protein